MLQVFDDEDFEYPYGAGLETYMIYPNATNATNCSSVALDGDVTSSGQCVDLGPGVNVSRPSGIPGGGASRGGELLSLRSWGLCPKATYACRFLSEETSPTGHIQHWLDSEPAFVDGPQSLACVTPAWGAHFPEVSTAIVLKVGNASTNTSALARGLDGSVPGRRGSTVGQSGTMGSELQLLSRKHQYSIQQELVTSVGILPFVFVCCVDVPITIAVPTYDASAKGGGFARWRVIDWALPFETSLYGPIALSSNNVNTVGNTSAMNATETQGNFTISFTVPALDGNVTVVAPSAALEDSENVTFTIPAGVGWGLNGFLDFSHLPLLRFTADGALNYRQPIVTSLRRGAFNNTGPTAGNFSLTVLGQDFGGADFGQEVHFLGIGLVDADNVCERTDWVSDSRVECHRAPAGSGSEMNVAVVAGNVYR